jgi:hypothetical protein
LTQKENSLPIINRMRKQKESEPNFKQTSLPKKKKYKIETNPVQKNDQGIGILTGHGLSGLI